MGLTLPDIMVALPFASAALLACVASWRAGVWINIAAATLAFLVACLSFGQFRTAVSAHLALLDTFVAMTTSWLGWRDIRAALAARQLDRLGARHHHVAFQALLGALLLASGSDSPAVAWLGTMLAVAAALGLTAVVRGDGAQRAAVRMVALCGAGLMLALFGTLLLYLPTPPDPIRPEWPASGLALICLALGYGAIAGLVPLFAWLPETIAEDSTPGAALIGALLANPPLLVMLRLSAAAAPLPLLVALGLATLLVAAFCLTARLDARRRLAFAGAAQVGLIVFAFGLGDPAASFAGLLLMTMLSLLRAAAPPALAAGPTREAAWTRTASVLALAGLPMVALVLLAGPAAACAPWLLLPLGAGVLLTTSSLIGAASPPPAARDDDDRWATALGPVPVWLNLAVVMLLAAAMPGPAAVWFRAVAALR